MELVRDARDREHPYTQIARLTLRHTYLPRAHTDFAGPSYFGGKDDQLVLCAGKCAFLVYSSFYKLNFKFSWRYPYLGTGYSDIVALRQTSALWRGLDMRCMELFHR